MMGASCLCHKISIREKYRHEGVYGTGRTLLTDMFSQAFSAMWPLFIHVLPLPILFEKVPIMATWFVCL